MASISRLMEAPVLRTRVDPASEVFQRNAAEHAALVAELRARLAAACYGGPLRARAACRAWEAAAP